LAATVTTAVARTHNITTISRRSTRQVSSGVAGRDTHWSEDGQDSGNRG
jgi:hypothetical protein